MVQYSLKIKSFLGKFFHYVFAQERINGVSKRCDKKKNRDEQKKVMFYTKKLKILKGMNEEKKLSFSGWHLRIAMISPFFSIPFIFFLCVSVKYTWVPGIDVADKN